MKDSVSEVLRESTRRSLVLLVVLAFGFLGIVMSMVMSMVLGGVAGIISLLALFVLAVWLLLYPEIRSSRKAIREKMEQFRKKGG